MRNKKAYFDYFKTVAKHRRIVRRLCFKCGFIKRGLLHDLSKYSIAEFKSSAIYFYGDVDTEDSEILKDMISSEYQLAWLHHHNHNSHHWGYWIEYDESKREFYPIRMSINSVVEMICDWIAAGIVYSGNDCDFNKPYREPLDYYNKNKDNMIIHPASQKLIEFYLHEIASSGVNNFCSNINKHVAH